ncbi:MAG: glycosyltransferase [Candidatus Marsarchaeota archaeon]|nr:glycosyltransferase [Candidatus Marsarchaeota archaeon]
MATKLLIVQPYLNIKGGVERVILEIARHYDAPVYTLEYNKNGTFPEYKNVDVKIIGKDIPLSDMLPYRASQGLRYGYNFYNLELKEDYDVINAHISPSEWIRHKNAKVLWYCHTPPREVYDLYKTRMQTRSYKERFLYATMAKAYKIIAGKVVRQIEDIATNSNTTKTRIKKYFNRDATVINPGIDYNKFYNESDSKYFLYNSRIVVNKRQEYVITAFKKFLSTRKNRDYKLVLAGMLSKDPEHIAYYEKLKKMSKGYPVTFITNMSDNTLRSLYANSTATLFAAINEDFGYVPLEGMASSKPVIAVNEGGPTETIINEKTGFLINSPEEMADKMKYLVEHKNFSESMGKEGRKHVSKNYSWEEFFRKFDAELKKVKTG